MKKPLATLLIAATVTLSASPFIAVDKAYASQAEIVSTVSFRSAPNTDSTVYRYLKKGEKVEILKQVNSYWYQVKASDGKTGYVSSNAKYIDQLQLSSGGGTTKNSGTIQSTVSFRSAPNTSSQVYRYMKAGEKVTIVSEVNSYWYQVRDANGKLGYVSSNSKYITVGSSGSNGSNGSNGGNGGNTATPSVPSSAAVEKVISAGMKYLGTPYEFGSDRSSTKTFDCSAFVRRAFLDALNIKLPSNSRSQADYVKEKNNTTTNWKNLKRGDLMFFMSYKGTSKSSYPSNKSNQRVTHVGIYLGNGQILHTYSKDSGGVRIDNISNKHWEYRFIFGGSAL